MSAKPSKNRGLGRGLDALFQDESPDFMAASNEDAPINSSRRLMPIENLKPGMSQPRQVFDDAALNQLAESIKTHGLLQPLLVRAVSGQYDKYEIIAGERRWRAAQKVQLHEVPVITLDLDDTQALEIALVENLQREDLNPVEEAQGYKRLMDEYGHTQEKLAEAVGKSRPHVANMMRLLALPDMVLHHLESGDLTMGHARALISSNDPEGLARAVISKGLNVRETEKLAADGLPKTNKKSSKKPQKDADLIALESSASNDLGMAVTIKPKAKGNAGTFEISYKSLDQLDEILKRLKA